MLGRRIQTLFNVHMPYHGPLIPCVRCSNSVERLTFSPQPSLPHLRFIESDCVGPRFRRQELVSSLANLASLDSLPVCEVSVSPSAGFVSSISIVWTNTMWFMVLPSLRPMTQELARKYSQTPQASLARSQACVHLLLFWTLTTPGSAACSSSLGRLQLSLLTLPCSPFRLPTVEIFFFTVYKPLPCHFWNGIPHPDHPYVQPMHWLSLPISHPSPDSSWYGIDRSRSMDFCTAPII